MRVFYSYYNYNNKYKQLGLAGSYYRYFNDEYLKQYKYGFMLLYDVLYMKKLAK